MKKYHYVYKLTNQSPTDSRLFYIGCRSCNCDPHMDNYFSSSKDIKNIIKTNGNTFKKEILKEFTSRSEAVRYEIDLHNSFNVSTNKLFYNKSKQSSIGFDTSGIIFIDGELITTDRYKNSKLKYHSNNMIVVKDGNDNIYRVSVDDDRYTSGHFKNLTTGKMPVLIDGSYKMIETSEYYKNKSSYLPTNRDKVVVRGEDRENILINKDDPKYLSGTFKSVHKGKVLCKDSVGKILYLNSEEFNRGEYVGVNSGLIGGSQNPNSKIIHIFNPKDECMFICNGNFKKVCKENNLPFAALSKSYRNGGKKIYQSDKGKNEANRYGFGEFIGFYSLLIRQQ